jgi:molybdopterin-guanine dinucleotide biosynthesis protein A
VIAASEITGVILCGGSGARMGGVDKPLQLLNGMPMVQHVRTRLVPQVHHVVLSANRHHDAYRMWNDVVIGDVIADAGPLGGVLTVSQHTQLPYLFCCPGDAPRLSTTLVATLCAALAASPADIAIPHDGTQPQHLFMLLSQRVANHLQQYLAAGQRSVRDFVSALPHVVVDCSREYESFVNVNTEHELQTVAQQLQ